MPKRLTALLLALLCLFSLPDWSDRALAGGRSADRAGHLQPQEGEYDPYYSVSATYQALPGKAFDIVLYEDGGTLPLQVARNSGSPPSGCGFAVSTTADGRRQARLTGLMLAEGKYSFSILVQEQADAQTVCTLAILHVTLHVTSDMPVTDPYLGDGKGMLRVLADGVNLRRTPGGTRLGVADKGDRMPYTGTQDKGGYTWYRIWAADIGYCWVRGDMVQEEPPLRLVCTPGKETAFPIFITTGAEGTPVPSLIMTERPDVIGFDQQSLVTVNRGDDVWTLLCFTMPDMPDVGLDEQKTAFFIKVDLRDGNGAPLECQVIYLTTLWEEVPPYTEN